MSGLVRQNGQRRIDSDIPSSSDFEKINERER
jgi:hypothetical protein